MRADDQEQGRSERLALEVVLLATAPALPPDAPVRASERLLTVIVTVREAELRDYIRDCLRERADVRVVEAGSSESPLEVAQRVAGDLVIADASSIMEGEPALLRGDDARLATPTLLTADERPEQLPGGDGVRVAFLLQPFNARRLLEMVEYLLAGDLTRRQY